MANSISGPATKLQLTLTGEGADPATMPETSAPQTPEKPVTEVQATPDTGIFTNDTSSLATPFIIGSTTLIISVIIFAIAVFLRPKKHLPRLFAKNTLTLRNSKNLLKKFSIFAGSLGLILLILGAVAPNLLPESESASALNTSNALEITTGSTKNGNVLPMYANLSKTSSIAVNSETINIVSSTKKGYTLYLSVDDAKGNSLYMNGEATRGYITPTTGSTAKHISLEPNRWGFAVSVELNTAFKNPAIWSAVPNYGEETIIKQTSSATPANDATTVVYGALVNSSIPAGDYTNTVIYTAIANI